MKLLISYATRSRPKRFFEGMESIMSTLSDKINFTIHVLCDLDDQTMNTEDIRLKISGYPNTIVSYGHSGSKIEAINRGTRFGQDWDILVNMSDDMRFVCYGWDQLIREGFQHNCPDLDGFLHYPDSTARNMLCTMSIIGRKYFLRDGYIYHPSYKSLFCDNEAMRVAQIRGKYYYMGIMIYDHMHPAYNLAEWDQQYQVQQGLWGVDENNFLERRAKKFDLRPEEILNESYLTAV